MRFDRDDVGTFRYDASVFTQPDLPPSGARSPLASFKGPGELPRIEQEGAFRGRNAAETLDLLQPFLRRAGITRVAVVHGLDVVPIPVVMVTRPLSSSLSVTQGKGVTLEQAKVSGIMEAIEHFHAETVEGVVRLGSVRELETADPAIDVHFPGRLPGFNADVRCLWQRGFGLISQRARWVPFDLVHLDLRTQGRVFNPLFVPTSNGLASGNCLEEATAHALYEVIERHSAYEFFRCPAEVQESRRVVLSSVYGDCSSRLLRVLAEADVRVCVWDLTGDTGVAAFLCEIVGGDAELRPVPMARGFGSHASPDVALARAICEAVQSRVTMISGSRDDMTAHEHEYGYEERPRHISEHHARGRRPATRLFRAVPSRNFGSFSEECEWLARTVERLGFGEPIVVDLSKSGWPIHVVRVIVPRMVFEPALLGGEAP